MKTNIEIDENLLLKAQNLTKLGTKKAVVEKALQLLIQFENQQRLFDLWGKIDIDEQAF